MITNTCQNKYQKIHVLCLLWAEMITKKCTGLFFSPKTLKRQRNKKEEPRVWGGNGTDGGLGGCIVKKQFDSRSAPPCSQSFLSITALPRSVRTQGSFLRSICPSTQSLNSACFLFVTPASLSTPKAGECALGPLFCLLLWELLVCLQERNPRAISTPLCPHSWGGGEPECSA